MIPLDRVKLYKLLAVTSYLMDRHENGNDPNE